MKKADQRGDQSFDPQWRRLDSASATFTKSSEIRLKALESLMGEILLQDAKVAILKEGCLLKEKPLGSR